MSAFFIRRPIVAMVIAIVTVLIGVVSLLGLPIAQFPQIMPPQINLTTTYTGADALTIEQSVATPIEQQMNGVDRMLYIQSTNANDGTMNQTRDVRRRHRHRHRQRAGAEPLLAGAAVPARRTSRTSASRSRSRSAFPLMVVSLYSPDGRYDPTFLANYAHHQHQRRAPARQGRRRHPQPRRVRLRDARLAEAGRAGAPGAHGERRAERASARRTSSTRPARSAPSRRRPGSSSRTRCARRGAS